MKKHLVYAEDLVYDIMQYPGSSIPKGVIRSVVEETIDTKSVSIWQHLWNRLLQLFKKA